MLKYIKDRFLYVALFLAISCSANAVLAQVLINGSVIHSLPNAIIYINSDSLLIENEGFMRHEGLLVIDKDLIVNDGEIDIEGTVDIEENLLNNDSIIGITANSLILLNGNWINNSVFIPGLNTTILDGTTQTISGSEITNYYNLQGLGTLADVKRLQGVDAAVLNELDLTDVEFATDLNALSVWNPNLNAIQRNDGFVSSLGDGRLERATNQMLPYLFPTGSSAGIVRYRPIEVTPNILASDTFGVRLANTNATNEGFDVLVLSDSLCAVNPNFYHRIYGNSAADITMFYIPSEDGEWDAMAQWQDSNQWEKLPDEFPSTAGQFSTMTIENWSDFSNNSFALGASRPFLELDDELTIDLGQTAPLSPNYIGPNPTSVVWFPIEDVDCPNCLDTETEPLETTLFNLEITITQNCIIRDSILIIVNPTGLFLPTAFSPNADGVNDVFRPLNNNLQSYTLSVYNRWGELVFRTDDFTQGWDGTYKGLNAEIGVYSFAAEYKLDNQPNSLSMTGNLTLIR